MQTNVTPQELEARINELLNMRNSEIDPALPNLRFCAKLEHCGQNTVCLRYHTYHWMANPNRVTHGGMVASILDTSMGTLCSALYEGGFTPTISMNVNYARPVPLDCDILVKIRASYTGTTSAHLAADLCLPDAPDVLLATATGVYHTARADTMKLKDLISPEA